MVQTRRRSIRRGLQAGLQYIYGTLKLHGKLTLKHNLDNSLVWSLRRQITVPIAVGATRRRDLTRIGMVPSSRSKQLAKMTREKTPKAFRTLTQSSNDRHWVLIHTRTALLLGDFGHRIPGKSEPQSATHPGDPNIHHRARRRFTHAVPALALAGLPHRGLFTMHTAPCLASVFPYLPRERVRIEQPEAAYVPLCASRPFTPVSQRAVRLLSCKKQIAKKEDGEPRDNRTANDHSRNHSRVARVRTETGRED